MNAWSQMVEPQSAQNVLVQWNILICAPLASNHAGYNTIPAIIDLYINCFIFPLVRFPMKAPVALKEIMT